MKYYKILSLLLLSPAVVSGMVQEASISAVASSADTQSSLILSLPELRLFFLISLFKTKPVSDAVNYFRAYSIVDKASQGFLKEKADLTLLFAQELYKIAYFYDFEITVLNQLQPLLNQKGLALFNEDLALGKKLKEMFELSAKQNQWDVVLKELRLQAEAEFSLLKNAVNYYWESTYCGSPAKMTLLVHALELDAPEDVIGILLSHGAVVDNLSCTTPPPFLITFTKFLSCHSSCSQFKVEAEDIQQLPSKIEALEKKMMVLTKAGASMHSFFYNYSMSIIQNQKMTPLLAAVDSGDPQMVRYLIKKGFRFVDRAAFFKAFFVNEGSLLMVKAVVSIPETALDFLRYLLPKIPSFNEIYQKKALVTLSLLLEQKIDLNATWHGVPLLAAAKGCGCNDKVVDMLIKKGFSQTPSNVKAEVLMNLYQGFRKGYALPVEERSKAIGSLLAELRTVLVGTDLDKLPSKVIRMFLEAALEFSRLPEAKEFLEYIATSEESLSLDFLGLHVTSVFHAIVAYSNYMRKLLKGNYETSEQMQNIDHLIRWLVVKGVKDQRTSEGKTAEERAKELGMLPLAETIHDSLVINRSLSSCITQ